MALAPRHAPFVDSKTGDKSPVRDSGLGKEGKKAQRARNADSADKKLTQNSGSSGVALRVAQMPKADWGELEPYLKHLTSIAGVMSHLQMGRTSWQSCTLNVPLAYAHEILEAHMASQQGMLFLKVYYVDTASFMQSSEQGREMMANAAEQSA